MSWYLIDTAEMGLLWIRATSVHEALCETGTWATGYTDTGVSRDGDATQLEAWDPRKAIGKALEPTGVGWCGCGGILADASTLQRKGTKCTRCGRMNWEGGENP